MVQVALDDGQQVLVRTAAPVKVQQGDAVHLTVRGTAHFYPSG